MNNMEDNKNLKNFILPTVKDEYWKYTRLMELKNKDYKYSIPTQSTFDIDFNGYKIFFENGFYVAEKSNIPDNVEILPISKKTEYLNKIATQEEPFVKVNNANIAEGIFVKVSQKVDKPIAIINHTQGDNIWYSIRNIIVVEENTSLELLEFYCYDGDVKSNYFNNIVNEVFVEQNATLNHYKIQKESFYANHIANTFVNVKKDAVYNNFTIQTGANIARNELKINLLEQGASTNFNSIYKMAGWALIDNTVQVFHNASNTQSNQFIKGVVNDQAKGVYQGKITINKDCNNVVGNQQHRAILLSESSEVDVKPELMIFNDDVKCSHGSAIGKLDEDALFYLQARGINIDDAKSLLINAFLKEIASAIQNLDIKDLFLLAI
ncbi:MAG: Fe-S cluster assembly protein SufD [Alphaproteobacteria bacterium]